MAHKRFSSRARDNTTPEKGRFKGSDRANTSVCPAKNGAPGATLPAASQGSLRFGRQRRYPILDPCRLTPRDGEVLRLPDTETETQKRKNNA
jgi:hypothetical protein